MIPPHLGGVVLFSHSPLLRDTAELRCLWAYTSLQGGVYGFYYPCWRSTKPASNAIILTEQSPLSIGKHTPDTQAHTQGVPLCPPVGLQNNRREKPKHYVAGSRTSHTGCWGWSSRRTLPGQSNTAGKLGSAGIQNNPEVTFSLACWKGVWWDSVSGRPINSKNGTRDRWGLYGHTSFIYRLCRNQIPMQARVHQRLGSGCSTVREQNPDQHAESCWGSPHPMPAADGSASQCHSHGCSKGQLRKWWETPAQARGCQTNHLLCRVCPRLAPRSPGGCGSSCCIPALLPSIPQHPLQMHSPGLGDQPSAPSIAGREGLFERAVKAGPRNETEIEDRKAVAGDSSKRLHSASQFC